MLYFHPMTYNNFRLLYWFYIKISNKTSGFLIENNFRLLFIQWLIITAGYYINFILKFLIELQVLNINSSWPKQIVPGRNRKCRKTVCSAKAETDSSWPKLRPKQMRRKTFITITSSYYFIRVIRTSGSW